MTPLPLLPHQTRHPNRPYIHARRPHVNGRNPWCIHWPGRARRLTSQHTLVQTWGEAIAEVHLVAAELNRMRH